MGQADHVGTLIDRRPCDALHTGRSLLERTGSVRHADRSADGRAHVGDDHIGTGLRHRPGLLSIGNVDDREEVHAPGKGNHVNLLLEAHSGFLEDLPELPIHDAVGGEVVHA